MEFQVDDMANYLEGYRLVVCEDGNPVLNEEGKIVLVDQSEQQNSRGPLRRHVSRAVRAGPTNEEQSGTTRRAAATRMERVVGRWAEQFRNEARQREAARAQRHQELIQLLRESNRLFESLTDRIIEKL